MVSLDVTDNQFVKQGRSADPHRPAPVPDRPRPGRGRAGHGQGAARRPAIWLRGRAEEFPGHARQAQAQLAAAKATLAKAQADYDRQKSLSRQATSQQDVDAAKAALLQARGAGGAGGGRRSTQNSPVPQRISETEKPVGQLQGQVEQAQARLEQADLNLSWTVVTRAAGRLDHQAQCRDRQLCAAGPADPLAGRRRALDHRQFQGKPARPHAAGQKVTIEVDAYPSLDLEGHVDSIQQGSGSKFTAFPPENATGNFVKVVQRVPVKIAIDSGLDPNLPLPLGISVDPRGLAEMTDAPLDVAPRSRTPPLEAAAANPWLIAVVGDARDLHGGARHHHRQCRPAAYRRHPVGQQRRGDLGADLLSRRQRHRADDLRLAWRPARAQALFRHLHRHVHGLLVPVRRRRPACASSSFSGWRRDFSAAACSPTSSRSFSTPFRRRKRGAAFGVAAMATIVAPVLGPTLGGFITDEASWRWIFFLNVPVGIIAVFLVTALVEDPPWVKKRKSRGIDFIGLSLISLGLGCLEIMMDRGEDADWFDSRFIQHHGAAGRFSASSARSCGCSVAKKPDRPSRRVQGPQFRHAAA